MGIQVIAADLNITVLHSKDNIHARAMRVQLDADKGLPFLTGVFDLAIVVHPQTLNLLETVAPTLRSGGHLILETFGAHGENWRTLPRRQEVLKRLSVDFDPVTYLEKTVPRAPDAVTVKGVFRKK